MSQAEGQQKNLLHSIESLPSRGPLSSLDPDLLLLKATSAATLSCLGECLSILQHNVSQAARNITTHTPGLSTDNNSGWSVAKPATDEPVENGSVMGLSNSTTNKASPSPAHRSSKEVHKGSELDHAVLMVAHAAIPGTLPTQTVKYADRPQHLELLK
ncbi:oxysterol-binding protein-related protein 10 isoform X1 [Tachysurus ichikawai]